MMPGRCLFAAQDFNHCGVPAVALVLARDALTVSLAHANRLLLLDPEADLSLLKQVGH
jgi:hypothetical protein